MKLLLIASTRMHAADCKMAGYASHAHTHNTVPAMIPICTAHKTNTHIKYSFHLCRDCQWVGRCQSSIRCVHTVCNTYTYDHHRIGRCAKQTSHLGRNDSFYEPALLTKLHTIKSTHDLALLTIQILHKIWISIYHNYSDGREDKGGQILDKASSSVWQRQLRTMLSAVYYTHLQSPNIWTFYENLLYANALIGCAESGCKLDDNCMYECMCSCSWRLARHWLRTFIYTRGNARYTHVNIYAYRVARIHRVNATVTHIIP